MRYKMKVIFKSILIVALSWNTIVLADNESPISGLRSNLESSLVASDGRNSLEAMKSVANDRNTDIEIAFQNYLIAKKNVSIARAAFNPITSGQVLGIALGVTYLWAPIALEAVLSIPTKIFNVSSNKYMEKAALYNSYEAKLALTNELSHLYYDVLTHEVILKSIDQELAILMFQQSSLEKTPNSASRVNDLKTSIISLKMEKIDIYNLYVEELAALKTLLSMAPAVDLKLAQFDTKLKASFLDGLNLDKLENFALINSNEYKRAINIHHAADQNVKSVEWSILSFSGFNFSYKARVREAKVNADIAFDQEASTKLKVENSVLMSEKNLESALTISGNYNSIYNQSIGLSEDYYKLYSVGNATTDAAVETSISAIRDFRNKVVAHYAAWSAFDDFSKAANFNFVYKTSDDSAQKQIEMSPLYDISESDFTVVRAKDYSNSFTLAVESDRNTIVRKVVYVFNENAFPDQTSTKDTKNFRAMFTKGDASPEHFSGTARIVLNNGHELEIQFKL